MSCGLCQIKFSSQNVQQKPKVLSCKHTICSKCLSSRIEVDAKEKLLCVSCPFCSKITTKPMPPSRSTPSSSPNGKIGQFSAPSSVQKPDLTTPADDTVSQEVEAVSIATVPNSMAPTQTAPVTAAASTMEPTEQKKIRRSRSSCPQSQQRRRLSSRSMSPSSQQALKAEDIAPKSSSSPAEKKLKRKNSRERKQMHRVTISDETIEYPPEDHHIMRSSSGSIRDQPQRGLRTFSSSAERASSTSTSTVPTLQLDCPSENEDAHSPLATMLMSPFTRYKRNSNFSSTDSGPTIKSGGGLFESLDKISGLVVSIVDMMIILAMIVGCIIGFDYNNSAQDLSAYTTNSSWYNWIYPLLLTNMFFLEDAFFNEKISSLQIIDTAAIVVLCLGSVLPLDYSYCISMSRFLVMNFVDYTLPLIAVSMVLSELIARAMHTPLPQRVEQWKQKGLEMLKRQVHELQKCIDPESVERENFYASERLQRDAATLPMTPQRRAEIVQELVDSGTYAIEKTPERERRNEQVQISSPVVQQLVDEGKYGIEGSPPRRRAKKFVATDDVADTRLSSPPEASKSVSRRYANVQESIEKEDEPMNVILPTSKAAAPMQAPLFSMSKPSNEKDESLLPPRLRRHHDNASSSGSAAASPAEHQLLPHKHFSPAASESPDQSMFTTIPVFSPDTTASKQRSAKKRMPLDASAAVDENAPSAYDVRSPVGSRPRERLQKHLGADEVVATATKVKGHGSASRSVHDQSQSESIISNEIPMEFDSEISGRGDINDTMSSISLTPKRLHQLDDSYLSANDVTKNQPLMAGVAGAEQDDEVAPPVDLDAYFSAANTNILELTSPVLQMQAEDLEEETLRMHDIADKLHELNANLFDTAKSGSTASPAKEVAAAVSPESPSSAPKKSSKMKRKKRDSPVVSDELMGKPSYTPASVRTTPSMIKRMADAPSKPSADMAVPSTAPAALQNTSVEESRGKFKVADAADAGIVGPNTAAGIKRANSYSDVLNPEFGLKRELSNYEINPTGKKKATGDVDAGAHSALQSKLSFTSSPAESKYGLKAQLQCQDIEVQPTSSKASFSAVSLRKATGSFSECEDAEVGNAQVIQKIASYSSIPAAKDQPEETSGGKEIVSFYAVSAKKSFSHSMSHDAGDLHDVHALRPDDLNELLPIDEQQPLELSTPATSDQQELDEVAAAAESPSVGEVSVNSNNDIPKLPQYDATPYGALPTQMDQTPASHEDPSLSHLSRTSGATTSASPDEEEKTAAPVEPRPPLAVVKPISKAADVEVKKRRKSRMINGIPSMSKLTDGIDMKSSFLILAQVTEHLHTDRFIEKISKCMTMMIQKCSLRQCPLAVAVTTQFSEEIDWLSFNCSEDSSSGEVVTSLSCSTTPRWFGYNAIRLPNGEMKPSLHAEQVADKIREIVTRPSPWKDGLAEYINDMRREVAATLVAFPSTTDVMIICDGGGWPFTASAAPNIQEPEAVKSADGNIPPTPQSQDALKEWGNFRAKYPDKLFHFVAIGLTKK